MRIAIAGGHGQVARHLSRALSSRGDVPVALVRQLVHVEDVVADGAEAVVLDLERANARDVAEAIAGADAVVFAAGAGPGSGAARKDTVDRAAAGLLADGAALAGVRRYVLVSSMGADAPPPDGTDEIFAAYLVAKRAAEGNLRERDLDWTILRPGHLTDDPPTGAVHLDERVPGGVIPRADVAEVLVALLHEPRTAGVVLELVGGGTPVSDAVTQVVSRAG
ncbi:NAD(P)H-binding protein [uncultured Cellulomonas sp.]|uniref:NAD(P)H-binding protein n=1 Tax=uncultured Cellulomonas sp. TaxID=189682 RepID=UPI0028EA4C39|nr:NAD(P)H-binding protein [uncultured Cellulomonas sp.]